MANQEIHDTAVAMAQAILDRVEGSLTYKERLLAIHDFYLVCKAGIECYESQKTLMLSRQDPSAN